MNVGGVTPRPIKTPLYGFDEEMIYAKRGHQTTSDLQPTPRANHTNGRLPLGRPTLGLECNYWSNNPECHPSNRLYLAPGNEVPSREPGRRSKGRPARILAMLRNVDEDCGETQDGEYQLSPGRCGDPAHPQNISYAFRELNPREKDMEMRGGPIEKLEFIKLDDQHP